MFSLPSLTQKLAISKASFLTPIRQLGALGYLKPHEGSTFNYKNWVVVNHQVRENSRTWAKGQKARSKVPWWFEGVKHHITNVSQLLVLENHIKQY